MHGITHFFHKHHSRESPPSLDKDDGSDSWSSALSSTDSRSSQNDNTPSKAVPINRRSSCTHRSQRSSPLEFASSPRDRYPNFSSYFRDVMEGHRPQSPHSYQPQNVDSRTMRLEEERYQSCVNAYRTSNSDYRQFVSPLYNEVMDEIQENEYSKCERYGEISSSKLSHTPFKSRFDNKSFAQRLTENFHSDKEHSHSTERRSSASSASGQRHKHSIQDLIRTFSKKVGHWRHDSGEGRRGSCAVPVSSPAQKEEFRSRSKSLDAGKAHKLSKRAALEDCGATYQIFESILQEGK